MNCRFRQRGARIIPAGSRKLTDMWNDVFSVCLTAICSLFILFLLTKLMGNKQISQLSMFDYIVGISIGSIAAELATELENPLLPAVAMLLYALIAFAISVLTSRFPAFRRIMTGKPLLLMDEGVLYRENMRKARFDISDFLTLCRINGFFDIADVQTAILEENGTVSFLPKAVSRPVEPSDLSIFPEQTRVLTNVVLDGVPLTRSLQALGYDEQYLLKELSALGYDRAEDVYLATMDARGTVAAYPMTHTRKRFSPFD